MRWEYRGVKDGRPLRDVVVVAHRAERIGGVPCAVVMSFRRSALRTEEWTPLEPAVRDAKWYVPGIGQVKEATLKGGDERAGLVSFRRR